MAYTKDHHTVYKCTYHVIFCPKYRRKVLINGVDTRLKELLQQYQKPKHYEIISMEVMADHVHLLLSAHPDAGIGDLVKSIKKSSAIALKKEFPYLKTQLPNMWTRSAFIATTGSVNMEVVKQYILDQKKV